MDPNKEFLITLRNEIDIIQKLHRDFIYNELISTWIENRLRENGVLKSVLMNTSLGSEEKNKFLLQLNNAENKFRRAKTNKELLLDKLTNGLNEYLYIGINYYYR
jgi:hypothetical protein